MSTRPVSRRTTTPVLLSWYARAYARLHCVSDRGMTTAEYAVGTLAAVAIVGVFIAVIKGNVLNDLLTKLVQRAFEVPKG